MIIQVYKPTFHHKYQWIEEFYQDLRKLKMSNPKRGALVVQGDWNVNIGTVTHHDWQDTAEECKHRKRQTNKILTRQDQLVEANVLHGHKLWSETT